VLFAKVGAFCVFAVGLVETLQGYAELVIVVGGAVGAITVAYRRVVRPMLHGVRVAEETFNLVAGDAQRPGLDARVESVERAVSKFIGVVESLEKIVDLARDEHVRDVRDLIRRGSIPKPPIDDPSRGPW
jgi:hypothetical protein